MVIFKRPLAEKVMAGLKTQTRRPLKANGSMYVVGRDYAVQPGRGKHAIGRLRITDARLEQVGEIGDDEALLEGFASRDEFIAYWTELYGAWRPETRVYVFTFEVI